MDSLQSYLFLSVVLFCLGLYGVMTRRNGVAILMGIELILNSANLNLVAFNRFGGLSELLPGHVFALFVIIMAASCRSSSGGVWDRGEYGFRWQPNLSP